MVLVLQLDDVYRGSILGFATQKMLAVKRIALVPPNHRVNRVFCVAGFRPGRRGPFVPAKGPKTIDAPSCLIGADGRQPREGGPTRYAHTRPAN